LIVFLGCSTTKPLPVSGGYSFSYSDANYQISSVNPESQIGYNLLMQRDDKKILMQAIDKNQDGILDEVVRGEVTLEKAQSIYAAGLNAGKQRGSLKRRTAKAPEYALSDMRNSYVLQTFKMAVGDFVNRLTIIERDYLSKKVVLMDNGADGRLNEMQDRENEDLTEYQEIYLKILQRGLADGKIIRSHGAYRVAMK